MRRYQSLGIGILSAVFCASMIGACSASGNDPVGTGTGSGGSDSGAAADTSYSYDAGPQNTYDSGSPSAPIDSGPVVVVDSGPSTSANDCDLSDPTTLIAAFTAAESGGDGACGAADACGAGDCCMNFASLGIPAEFTAFFSSSSAPVCVAE